MKWLWSVAILAGCSTEPSVTPGVITPEDDASVDTAIADTTAPLDGAPFPLVRSACVTRGELANDLPSEGTGALEGTLVALVPPGHKSCPSDPDHLHLQVAVGTKRYDVAVAIDSSFAAPLAIYVQKRPLSVLPPDGWSGALFDYEKDIAVPSADYKALTRDAMLARLQAELANAARVRIYGRTYLDKTGLHNVHRNGRGADGVILIHHIDGGDRAIALRFANDVF